MSTIKIETDGRSRSRPTDANRERVLAAAERLLRRGSADFSMRDLAAEAGVSFATPFNLFGGKSAIAQALSARRIDLMASRLRAAPRCADAIEQVLAAVRIAVAVLLEDGEVSRAVIGSLGMPTGAPGAVSVNSRELWSLALTDGIGLDPERVEVARAQLPWSLALMFRGCLSFWAAGEIADADLHVEALSGAAMLLLGFAPPPRRAALMELVGRRRISAPGGDRGGA